MIVYIVQMERQVTKPVKEELPHRYVVGVYTSSSDAHKAGELEETWRKGEYKYFLHDFVLDKVSDQKLEWAVKELMTENLLTNDRRFG
jgi:hypothetical protein